MFSCTCCGGFVVTQFYGVARTTSDVDFLGVVPNVRAHLNEIAGRGSTLHRKHKVYLDAVTVATPPENYEERLTRMFPSAWDHLRLFALEAHAWLSPSWNGTLTVIVKTCRNSRARV